MFFDGVGLSILQKIPLPIIFPITKRKKLSSIIELPIFHTDPGVLPNHHFFFRRYYWNAEQQISQFERPT